MSQNPSSLETFQMSFVEGQRTGPTEPTEPTTQPEVEVSPVAAVKSEPTIGFSDFSDALDEEPIGSSGLAMRRSAEVNLFNSREDSVDFVHCLLTEGDVLVFIDYPEAPGDTRPRINCDGIRIASSQCFRVHSRNLLALPDSKFAPWLDNAIYQARVKRRRKPTPKQLEGINYLLDLTPPQEGDELVFQMMELSLTPGLIKWWASTMLHDGNAKLVGGHDDLCTCALPAPTAQEAPDVAGRVFTPNSDREKLYKCLSMPPSPDALLTLQARGEEEIYETPHYRRIPDYCPFRHCNSIIRLLLVIEGGDVKLNSAPRVWTMVKVAKLFDCAAMVRDRVVQWIMYNSRFVEVLPEEALSIGFDLQLPHITQSAFRILVNELALAEAADDNMKQQARKTTVFGRRLGDAGDERSNIIQHAARNLIDRVKGQFAQLLNPDMFDFWEIGEWKKLRSLEHLLQRLGDEYENGAPLGALNALRRLMEALPHKVTHKVNTVMENAKHWETGFVNMDRDRARYVEAFDFKNIVFIFKEFNQTQHLLCPFVYQDMGEKLQAGLFAGQRSMHPDTRGALFSSLVSDVEAELRLLLDRNPALTYRDEWSSILYNRPRAALKDAMPLPIIRTPIMSLLDLEQQVIKESKPIIESWMRVKFDITPELNITRHLLLTLNDNEMKFLPLWAGGNDDGTGGVFEEFLPPAEMGPNGPGPAYHTGMTIPSAPPSLSGSLMDEITNMKIMGSTTAGSVDVHDSISTVYRPDQVIVGGSSLGAESFADNDSEFEAARFAQPADHQAHGQTTSLLVDAMDEDDLSDGTEVAFEYEYDDDDDDNDTDDDGDKKMDNNDKRETGSRMDGKEESDARSETSSMVLV